MDTPKGAYTKPKIRQPSGNPTSLETVRFVILGGPDAGIHTLTESVFFSIMFMGVLTNYRCRHSDLPPAGHAGPCPPLSIMCRSSADAQKVWELQPTMKVVETRGRKEIAAAFMMYIVVRDLFASDRTAQFHTAFLGIFNRPVVYFSWSGNPFFT